MDKVTIHISANEQLLTSAECPLKVASNTVSYIEAVFELGENWTGYDSVRAVWSTYRDTIATVLDSEGKCVVPHEVMTRTQKVFVNLVGSVVEDDELTDRLTTYPILAVVVNADALVEGTETAPITPSQFEQFVNEVSEEVSKIKDIVSTTLNDDYTLTFVFSDGTETTVGPIRGEQGEQGIQGIQGPPGPPGEVTLATLESLMPTDTASGAIASFPDGQNVFPLKSLIAEIDPIQDLHGYDSPWVAGGGKNKINESDYSSSQFSYSNGTFTNTTTDTRTDFRMYLRGIKSDNTYDVLDSLTINTTGTKSLTFTTSNDYVKLLVLHSGSQTNIAITFNNVSLSANTQYTFSFNVLGYNPSTVGGVSFKEVQVEKGASATSWTPYSNICPISGTDEVGVVDCAENLCDNSVFGTWSGVTAQSDGSYYAQYSSSLYLKKAWENTIGYTGQLKVIFKSKYAQSGVGSIVVIAYTDGTTETIIPAEHTIWAENSKVTNSSKTVEHIRFSYNSGSVGTYFNLLVTPNTNAEHYHAYNGTTHTTTLPSTVYGGTLDVVNGMLTVTHGIVDLGDLSFSTSAPYKYVTFNDAKPPTDNSTVANILAENYKTTSRNNMTNNCIAFTKEGYIYIRTTDTPSGDFCYELATPQTIQLTPTQVQTLLGTNNIFSTSGDVSVVYVADIQGYIDKQ